MIGRIVKVVVAAGLVVSTLAGGTALAKDGDVIREGACSGTTDWKLKLSREDGRLEVEYEIDSNVVGQTWRVRIFQDGERIFAGQRTTKAPSGSFEVRVLATNTAGTDSFRGRAVNPATDEVCGGRASIG